MPTAKQRASAAVGLPGVRGDGGRRQINRGTWETLRCRRTDDACRPANKWWEQITIVWHRGESEGPIVVRTLGNAGRAKGSCRDCIVVSGKSFNMELRSHKIGHGHATFQDDLCADRPSDSFRACLQQRFPGKPDAGNLHVRFEEGGGSSDHTADGYCGTNGETLKLN
jgi:hypothetical protein